MEKNVAGKWVVFAYGLPDHANDGQPITGDAANITANIRIDGGAANAVDDTNPTELEDGYYVFDITAAEANGDLLSIHPASSTSDVQVIGVPGAVWTRPANFNAMGIESDGDLTKVNTLDGHTAQTGDNYARLGAPAGASVSADIAAIEAQTDDIGVAGAGLTAVPWNSSWDAEVQSEVTDALNAYDPPTKTELDSGFAALNDVSTAQVNAEVDTAISDALNDIADAILKRDFSSVSGEASRSMLNALRFLRNKWSISGTTLTVTEEDDTTSAWTSTVSTDAAADPVTGSDPA